MARLEIILILSAAVLFCGCGGTPAPAPGSAAQVPSSPSQIPPAFGNWQLTPRPLSPESLRLRLPAVSAKRHCGHQRAPCRRFELFRQINHHELFTITETGNTTSSLPPRL